MTSNTRKKPSGLANTKCGNQPFWLNNNTSERYFTRPSEPALHEKCSYWASSLEYQVYCSLRSAIPAESIERQAVITTIPKSSFYPATTWKCDFMVKPSDAAPHLPTTLVEAKGKWLLEDKTALREYRRMMKELAYYSPNKYLTLLSVSNEVWSIDERISTITPAMLANLAKEWMQDD